MGKSMNWAGVRTLVTGAGGFIGSHLTERLVSLGADVRAMVRYNSQNFLGWLKDSPVRSEINFFNGDVRDADSVEKAVSGVEVVFNLAALIGIPYSYQTPRAYIDTNLGGTLNLLQAARNSNCRIIQTSTSEVYGTARYAPIDENHPLQGQSPYSASKIAADKLCEAFFCSFSLPVAIVRPFNTYGPRQSARAILPTIIAQCLTREELRLGSTSPTRDMNYVADTVNGFIEAAGCDEALGKSINIGSGIEISIGQMAERVMDILGKQLPIVVDGDRLRPPASEVGRLVANNRLACELMNWQSATSFDAGLRLTIDWVREHLSDFNPGQYTT